MALTINTKWLVRDLDQAYYNRDTDAHHKLAVAATAKIVELEKAVAALRAELKEVKGDREDDTQG